MQRPADPFTDSKQRKQNNRLMKRYFLFLIALFAATAAATAQSTVTGRVTDPENTAVGYATVAALREQLPVAAVAADAEGRFTLTIKEAGDYTLSISAVGYTTRTQPLKAAGKPIELGDLRLEAGVEVEAVVLTVQRPIVTTDAEKLAYSVEDDPEAQSSTLEEIIRKVPQLSIDADGNVQMNGQSDYKILVNGHPSNAMSRNFSEVIKSMPANSIKRIEVITNPSMKYDAEGTGGVLNIITSKARFDGYNGSLNASYNIADTGTWMTNNSANLAVQTDKLTLSGAFYYSYADGLDKTGGRTVSSLENLADDSTYKYMNSEGEYGFRFRSLYANLQASYQIDSLNLLTAELSAYDGYSRTRQENVVEYLDALRDPIRRYKSRNDVRPEWGGYDLDVNYEHTFRREGHTLTFSDNVSIAPPTGQPSEERITDLVGTAGYGQLFNNNRAQNLSNVLQIDYNNPLGKGQAIEAGFKHNYDYDRQRSVNTYDESLETRGDSRLTKHILGLYAGYSYTTQKLAVRFGARLESARYKLSSDDNGVEQHYTSSLTNIVPYASLTLTPAMGQMFALTYTQRLRRPNVSAMSPYVSESLTTRTYGNPDLETGISHSVNLRYSRFTNKWTLAVGLTSNLSDNLASAYSFIDDEGFINSTYANDGRMQFHIGDLSLSYRPSQRLNLSASLRGGWGRYRLPNQGIETEGWSYAQSFNATLGLWKGSRLTLSEYLSLPEISMTNSYGRPFLFTSLRLGQKFLKEKLEFSVAVANPFEKSMKFSQRTETPSYIQRTCAYNYHRGVRFSLSWRFGKQQIAVKQTNRKADTTTESVGGSDKSASAGGGMGGM